MDSAVAMSSRLVTMHYAKPRTHAQHIYYFSNGSIILPGFKFTELHALTLAARSYALLLLHTGSDHKLDNGRPGTEARTETNQADIQQRPLKNNFQGYTASQAVKLVGRVP